MDVDIQTPFLRLSYEDAMNRFGVDKPDMRFGVELIDCNSIFENSDFKSIRWSGSVRRLGKAINAKGLADITQGELKDLKKVLNQWVQKDWLLSKQWMVNGNLLF